MLGLALVALLLLLLFGGLGVWVSEAFFIALVVVLVLALAGGVYSGRGGRRWY
jgi:intracellular septation protein A